MILPKHVLNKCKTLEEFCWKGLMNLMNILIQKVQIAIDLSVAQPDWLFNLYSIFMSPHPASPVDKYCDFQKLKCVLNNNDYF